jgi:transcriptional regulator with XRE-family HTH domain
MLTRMNSNNPGARTLPDRISIAALGDRVRAERSERRMSLDDIASRSGVSRSMVSAIERGTKVPTVLVLDRIANALGISVSRLLDEERSEKAIFLSVDEQKVVKDAAGWHRRIVSPVLHGVDFELARVVFDAGVDAGEFSAHPPGWTEYVAVEAGELEVVLHGDERHLLGSGDSLYFESDVSHAFKNPGKTETIAYLAMNGTGVRR